MIVCGERCSHQCEGYCTLDEISRLTSAASSKCGYFEPTEKTRLSAAMLPEDPERFLY